VGKAWIEVARQSLAPAFASTFRPDWLKEFVVEPDPRQIVPVVVEVVVQGVIETERERGGDRPTAVQYANLQASGEAAK
jgi:hypothetical protein